MIIKEKFEFILFGALVMVSAKYIAAHAGASSMHSERGTHMYQENYRI